jgi:hypothetical protein
MVPTGQYKKKLKIQIGYLYFSYFAFTFILQTENVVWKRSYIKIMERLLIEIHPHGPFVGIVLDCTVHGFTYTVKLPTHAPHPLLFKLT